MQRALPDFPGDLAALGPGYPGAIRYWEPRSIHATSLSFAFFRRLFVDLADRTSPPGWGALIPGLRTSRRTRPEARATVPVRA